VTCCDAKWHPRDAVTGIGSIEITKVNRKGFIDDEVDEWVNPRVLN
jgi:hypothetical protein